MSEVHAASIFTLKKKAAMSSKTMVTCHKITRRHDPEELESFNAVTPQIS
jgi:hypothetical protein